MYRIFKDILYCELERKYKIDKGFVLYGNKTTQLIDMIIYENDEIYRDNKFVIVESCNVRAILKIVGDFKPKDFYSIITNFCKIKAKMQKCKNSDIFAGIVSYPCENLSNNDFIEIKNRFEQKLQDVFTKNQSFVNCASFSKIWFMRKEYRDEPNMDYLDTHSCDFYDLNLPYISGVSSYKYLIGNIRKHLNLSANDYFLHPESKQEANIIKIILQRTPR